MCQKMILYICGFWIQILPCAYFCLYPFRDRFRGSRRAGLALLAALIAAASVCFAWIYVMSPVSEEYHYLAAEVVFYLTLLALLAAYILLLRVHILHKLFVFLVIMNYGFLMTRIASEISNRVLPPKEEYIYRPLWLITYAAANAVAFLPMRNILRRLAEAFRNHTEGKFWRGMIMVPLGFILILSLCYELPETARMDSDLMLELFSGAVQVLMLFFIYWVLRLIETDKKRAEQSLRLEAAVENYRNMAENSHEIRKIRHEVNHHLTALSLYLRNRDYAGASEYLNRVQALASRMPTVEYTPHMLLNAMLTEYKKKASAEGIASEYEIMAPGPIGMDDMDLCQFLSNLLDNAIEGAVRAQGREKKLHLVIRQNGNFLFFSCENTCDEGKLRYVNGRPASSKAEAFAGFGVHGYGIPIMEHIAGKYNGVFQMSVREGVFCARANLCLPEDGGSGITEEKDEDEE